MINLTKYIVVTGGVVSSIGKGITAASIGRILRSYGVDVTAIKIDPYLNWDSGTLNPYEHGEVFVTDDGMETALDLGHYERFLDVELSGESNITTGKVYSAVINQERKGISLGPVYRSYHISQMKLSIISGKFQRKPRMMWSWLKWVNSW